MESHEQESNHQGYFRCADGTSGCMVLRVILSGRLCAGLRHLSKPDIAAYGGGFAALLCDIVFLWQLFLQKGNRKVQICNFIFLIPAVASLGLWGNSAAVKDEDAEVKAVLEDYIKEEMDGKVLFLNLTEVPRSFYQNPSADAPYYDAQDYDWRYYNVSFYYEDQQDKEASGDYHWNAYMVKEDAEAAWKVVSLGES